MKKIKAIYVRRSVSDKDKDNNSLSIDSQKADCIKSLNKDEEYRILIQFNRTICAEKGLIKAFGRFDICREPSLFVFSGDSQPSKCFILDLRLRSDSSISSDLNLQVFFCWIELNCPMGWLPHLLHHQ